VRSTAALLVLVAGACGSNTSRARIVPPRFPNAFGTVVATDPDNGGEVFAHAAGDVSLRLSDGRRFVLPPAAAPPGASGLLCRTRAVSRADGTYAPPCHVQTLVTHGRAAWLEVMGAGTVGTAVAGSARWLVLADGTAVPMPSARRRPVINCPTVAGLQSIDDFTHRNHLVRVSVDDDGTLARVDCLSSMLRP
jgi:hypothetical protein